MMLRRIELRGTVGTGGLATSGGNPVILLTNPLDQVIELLGFLEGIIPEEAQLRNFLESEVSRQDRAILSLVRVHPLHEDLRTRLAAEHADVHLADGQIGRKLHGGNRHHSLQMIRPLTRQILTQSLPHRSGHTFSSYRHRESIQNSKVKIQKSEGPDAGVCSGNNGSGQESSVSCIRKGRSSSRHTAEHPLSPF